MSSRKSRIESARKFVEGYFDPEKDLLERQIKANSNALAKTTDPEDKDLYAKHMTRR